MDKNNTGINRRQLLKNSVAGAMVAFAATDVVSAKDEKTELSKEDQEALIQDFRDANTVRDAVHQQSDVLEELTAEGVIEAPVVDDLEELTTPVEGVGEHVTTYKIGERHTPRLKIFRRVDAGYLSLSVFPEEDTAHAILNPVEDGKPLGKDHLIKYGSMPDIEVEPESCWSPTQCYGCTDYYTYCCGHELVTDKCTQYCQDRDCWCASSWC